MTKAARIRQLREATSYSFTALVRHRDKGLVVPTDGEATIAEHFAITRHLERPKNWVVTHMPSGYSVGFDTTNKRLARLVCAIFQAYPIDWGTTNTENSCDRMKGAELLYPELKVWRQAINRQ